MNALSRSTSLLLAAVLAAALVIPADAGAQEGLRGGSLEVTLAGGYSIRLNTQHREGLEDITGYHAIPHLGFVLTDERGPGVVRGNFVLLAEPTVIYLKSASESATVVGGSLGARWLFIGTGTVRPYIELGGGAVAGQLRVRQSNCDRNFIGHAGLGLLVFVSERAAVSAGYRFHHLSNANLCTENLGLNSSMLVVGLSYFFQ